MTASAQTVLVTGATGFLGSAICDHLRQAGARVRAFIRPGSTHPRLDPRHYHFFEGDINDTAALTEAMSGCDCAIHTVFDGRYGRRWRRAAHKTNVGGSSSFLEACVAAGVPAAVVADTISSLYAPRRTVDFVTDTDKPVGTPWLYPYLQSKLDAREMIHRFSERLAITTLRCSPLYGAGDKHSHTGQIITYLNQRVPFASPPGGTSVVSVEDAARAFVSAALRPVPGDYVLSSERLTFVSLYNLILSLLGRPERITRQLPHCMFYPLLVSSVITDLAGGALCPYVVRNGFSYRFFESRDAASAFGWQPRVPIHVAIAEQIEWMRACGAFVS